MDRRARFELTGFGDEISPELSEQLSTLTAEGVRYLELRGIWNKNVLDLDEADVERAREQLAAHGVAVSAIASPIGKVPVDIDFEGYLPRFERALEMARSFGSRYVRVFSFYPPRGEEERCREEIIRRLSVIARRAQEVGVVLLLENDQELFGDTPRRCLEIVRDVDSPALRIAFDPANYVWVGVKPFDDAYPLLADYVEYVHIKDALRSSGATCLPGQGDGQIPQLLAALRARGYQGFLSLEPHLTAAGRSSGFSGPGLFADAIRALNRLLAAVS